MMNPATQLSNLPAVSSVPSDLKASYVVPEGILRQLLASSQRLDQLLSEPDRSTKTTSSPQVPENALLGSVPTDQRKRAAVFLDQLLKYPNLFAVNSQGNAVLSGEAIKGSNLSDMIGVLLRATPTAGKDDPAGYWRDRLPHGTQRLLQSIALSPIGSSLIRNQYLAQEVDKIRMDQEREAQSAQQQLDTIDSIQQQLKPAAMNPVERTTPSLLTAYRLSRKRKGNSDRSIFL